MICQLYHIRGAHVPEGIFTDPERVGLGESIDTDDPHTACGARACKDAQQ
jgi:hypothetical protein